MRSNSWAAVAAVSLIAVMNVDCAQDQSVGPRNRSSGVSGSGGTDEEGMGPASGGRAGGGQAGSIAGAGGTGGGGGSDTGGSGAEDAGMGTGGAPEMADAAPVRPDSGEIPEDLCSAGDCRAIAGDFDGFLYSHPCSDRGTGFDCLGTMCSGGASTRTQAITIKGDPARIYQLTFKVRGVVESKNYSGGKRRATGLDPSATGGDQWYEGGTAPNSTYNTYELHVSPKVAGAPNDYFLNARDGSPENHSSWALNYTASIKVQGGGTITFRSFDSNCRQIMNCGPGGGSNMCRAPRTLDLTGAIPAPPGFMQPPRNAQGATGQWVLIDVTEARAI